MGIEQSLRRLALVGGNAEHERGVCYLMLSGTEGKRKAIHSDTEVVHKQAFAEVWMLQRLLHVCFVPSPAADDLVHKISPEVLA